MASPALFSLFAGTGAAQARCTDRKPVTSITRSSPLALTFCSCLPVPDGHVCYVENGQFPKMSSYDGHCGCRDPSSCMQAPSPGGS